MLFGNFIDFIKARRTAEGLDRNDGFGFRRDGLFDSRGVDIQCFRVDIHQYRLGSHHQNHIGGGNKCKGCRDDFVARPYPHRLQAQVQAAGAAIYSHGMLSTCIMTKGFFELSQLGTQRKIRRPQYIGHGFDFGFGDIRPA